LRFVFKFGGSSLATSNHIKKVAEFIKTIKQRKNLELVIVVSAMGKTTNMLETLANKVTSHISPAYSSLICLGENISTFLLTLALENIGIDAVGLTSKDIKISSQGHPTNSIITHIDKTKIEEYLNQNKVVVISGFQGENFQNQTLSLGRGGSDTTAVALGNVLNANVKIFTDVKGFYTLNPEQYNSKLLKKIHISSAINLSNTNAKVLDYRCLCLLNQNKTPLTVCESLKEAGTQITFNPIETYKVDGISVKNNMLYVKNQSKKSKFLQTIMQNVESKTYFYEFKEQEHLASNITLELLKNIANVNKQKLIIKQADILTLTGSGLLIHKHFCQKVQNCINKLKKPIYYFNLTQTTLTLIIKKNQAQKLEHELAKTFNLIKE